MKKKTTFLLVFLVISFLITIRLAAEVAVEEVVQAGRFVFYRDHADPHKYYYVPDQPRLATKRDGTPEFTFIKYTKTDGATKGGVLHFLVTWGFTSGELSSAESALKSIDAQAKLAGPVPFKEGTFQIISATAGKDGIFNRRIVGEGKAPVLPGQKAAVSIALTEEGASLLWESFKNPTSDVSVQYLMKFSGITPAFQAKLKVDWDKVYTQHDIKAAVDGMVKGAKLRADLEATLEELRQKGAIQLEVVGENENMQKLLETAYTHILNLMCDRVPAGAGTTSLPSSSFLWIKKGNVESNLWAVDYMAGLKTVESSFGHSITNRERTAGPSAWEQQEQQSASAETFGCSAADRRRADQLYQKGLALGAEKKYADAIDQFKKAYAACPDPIYYYQAGIFSERYLYLYTAAIDYYKKFLELAEGKNAYPQERQAIAIKISEIEKAHEKFNRANSLGEAGQYIEAGEEFILVFGLVKNPRALLAAADCFEEVGNITEKNRRENYERALELYEEFLRDFGEAPTEAKLDSYKKIAAEKAANLRVKIAGLPATQPQEKPEPQAQVTAAAAAATTGAQQAATDTKKATTGQAVGQTTSGQATAVTQTTPPPTTTSGAQTSTQTGRPQATQPTTSAPEVKPISVQLGYSFKRTKLSGRYEVDMRRRLREDREVVMSGNISGVYQNYGEDKRFFTVVSLDDPAFQERSIEVILDGQDAEDFKNYVNSVSVIFRKPRLAGPVMTGEVKFFEQQFAERGNRLSFKYGRVNEAATEWLNYEYKTMWNFYGGVEWESDWVKTSDSVLTLTPPIRRRTIEISVDEDNILQNKIKAVAIQVKHNVYGKDILKEVVINYDKGDPLQVNYTYLHEEGKPGYSYRVIWLTLDGKEVETNWVNREGPFIYAVFEKQKI